MLCHGCGTRYGKEMYCTYCHYIYMADEVRPPALHLSELLLALLTPAMLPWLGLEHDEVDRLRQLHQVDPQEVRGDPHRARDRRQGLLPVPDLPRRDHRTAAHRRPARRPR